MDIDSAATTTIASAPSLYQKQLIEGELVKLHPRALGSNISETLLETLKKKIEGKCIAIGYVKPGSIKIIKQSDGVINPAHFNGYIEYRVGYTVDICNPLQGQIIKVKVNMINKIGIQAYVGTSMDTSPLRIILPKSMHLNNKMFIKIAPNDEILMKVVAVNYELYKTIITVIGVLAESVSNKNEDNDNEDDEDDDNYIDKNKTTINKKHTK